jgi:hypothetical protein
MTSSSPPADSTPQLPDYAPVPEAALGPALNEHGYHVGRVERNLFSVTDGYIEAPSIAQSYPWTHYIGGHLGRVGNRDTVALHQQYIADIQASVKQMLGTVDPTPYFVKYGANVWAAVQLYLDTITDRAAEPIMAKYTGVLAAADVKAFVHSTTFMILHSTRLDFGPSGPLHP